MHGCTSTGRRSSAVAAGAIVTALALAIASGAGAQSVHGRGPDSRRALSSPTRAFRHVGTFDVIAGNGSAVAEIVDVTKNGKQLVYTDSEQGAIGFVDISDPTSPSGQGTVAVGGAPTSLVVLDPLVLVGVDTTEDLADPSGRLVVVHRHTRRIVAVHELGGQPDSLALAPDRKRLAIVIENQRDEELNDGLIPQPPSGRLLIVGMRGAAKRWTIFEADLSPVAENAFVGEDLEPEFVDVNNENEAVVSFQENSHLAIVDLVTGSTIHQFAAGSAELNDVDVREDGLIVLDSTITRRREPDAVAWIDGDSFATANEGDYQDELGEEGGSRGFTIFHQGRQHRVRVGRVLRALAHLRRALQRGPLGEQGLRAGGGGNRHLRQPQAAPRWLGALQRSGHLRRQRHFSRAAAGAAHRHRPGGAEGGSEP